LLVVFQGRAAYVPSFPRAQNEKEVEKSVKMSWIINTAVERRSAREVKCGWEARFPRFFKAKGIAD
jgi:hypothetical protein